MHAPLKSILCDCGINRSFYYMTLDIQEGILYVKAACTVDGYLTMLKGIFYRKKMQTFTVYLSFSNISFFLFLLSANRAAHA